MQGSKISLAAAIEVLEIARDSGIENATSEEIIALFEGLFEAAEKEELREEKKV